MSYWAKRIPWRSNVHILVTLFPVPLGRAPSAQFPWVCKWKNWRWAGSCWVQPGPHELEQHSDVPSPQGGKHPRWWGRKKGNRHVRRTEPNSFQPIRLKNICTLKQMQKADLTIVKLYAKVFPKNIKRVYPINDLKYFVDWKPQVFRTSSGDAGCSG